MALTRQHRNLLCTVLAAITCLAFLPPACTAFQTKKVVVVPHDVTPGYVVTSLPYLGQEYTIDTSRSSLGHMTRYFMVMSTGDVVVSSNISSLLGRKISIVVQNDLGTERWQDTVNIDIQHRDKIITFSQQRYEGYVLENMPAGTIVEGLESLNAIISGKKVLRYSLISGSVDQFRLVLSPGLREPQLYTTRVLDHERVKQWYVEIEAATDDSTDEPVYAKIRVTVLNQNDNEPAFCEDLYHVTIKGSTGAGTTITRVTADDPDGGIIRYTMYPHHLFKVDPFSGSITLKRSAKLLPKTYVIEVFAEDDFGRKSKPANVQIDVSSNHGNLYYEPHAGRHHHDRRTRWRRDTLTVKEVEVMESMTGRLVDLPNNVHERFAFKSPAPDMLEIDAITGTIRLKPDKRLDYESQPEVDFAVRITRDDNSACKSCCYASFLLWL